MRRCTCSCHSHSGFLTSAGYAEVAQRTSLEGLAPLGDNVYVDKEGSVSAFGHGPDHSWPTDNILDVQAERFHNGF